MASIFTKIVNGEIPCHKIAETENYLAFLDVRPQSYGHTLCITKEEISYVFDVEDELYAGLWMFSKIVAKALKKVVPCKRVCVVVIGDEVPHTHVHLIPFNSMEDVTFSGKAKVEISQEEMAELAAKVAAAVV
ncbi:MAG: HIT family protein [Saprospiraceae bacterium]|nr:HIT family protein [Saprospiraceae bacterium]MCB9344332.1 HIT family protein [Lewinellaceae bacterium]